MFRDDLTSDPYNLQRFLDAQDATYTTARAELAAGEKRSHWMWFIFPQIRGLGSSAMAQRFAIYTGEEAVAYLDHPVLGARLRECTSLVNDADDRSISEIFGYPDDLKFHSSMTLFYEVAKQAGYDSKIFAEAMDKYFHGKADAATIALLSSPAR